MLKALTWCNKSQPNVTDKSMNNFTVAVSTTNPQIRVVYLRCLSSLRDSSGQNRRISIFIECILNERVPFTFHNRYANRLGLALNRRPTVPSNIASFFFFLQPQRGGNIKLPFIQNSSFRSCIRQYPSGHLPPSSPPSVFTSLCRNLTNFCPPPPPPPPRRVGRRVPQATDRTAISLFKHSCINGLLSHRTPPGYKDMHSCRSVAQKLNAISEIHPPPPPFHKPDSVTGKHCKQPEPPNLIFPFQPRALSPAPAPTYPFHGVGGGHHASNESSHVTEMVNIGCKELHNCTFS